MAKRCVKQMVFTDITCAEKRNILTQAIRDVLVSNITLSYLARHYRLSDILTLDKSTDANYHEGQSLLADAFEAHVGGLYQDMTIRMKAGKEGSKPYLQLEAWMRQLFSRKVFRYMDSYAKKGKYRHPEKAPKRCKPKPERDLANQGKFGEHGTLSSLNSSRSFPHVVFQCRLLISRRAFSDAKTGILTIGTPQYRLRKLRTDYTISLLGLHDLVRALAA
jgi:hypothetical protein